VQRRKQKKLECFNDIKFKKKTLMEKIAARDLAIQQTSHHFADAELGRLNSTKSALQAFIALEKKQLAARMKALDDLESWVSKVNVENDLKLFIKQEKKIDFTHKYHTALQLLDLDYERRICKRTEKEADISTNTADDASKITAVGADDDEVVGGVVASEGVTSTEDVTILEHSADSNDNNAPETIDHEMIIINPRLQGMQNVLSGLFADVMDTKTVKEYKWELNEAEWGTLLSSTEASDYFLQVLDERRGRHCALNDRAFQTLAVAMKVFLDYCEHNVRNDVKSAMRIANMANTFHKDTSSREYLQNEAMLRDHKIWKGSSFWQDALLAGVEQQMDLIDSVKWDDLSQDTLREVVVSVHNIIFGQLGTIAFTMHELGLTLEQVEKNARDMCRLYQLTEDQEQELLASIRATFNYTGGAVEKNATAEGVAIE